MATPIFPPGASPDVLTPVGGGPPISYTDSVNAVDKAFSDVFNRPPSGQDLNDWVTKGYAYLDNANGVAQFEQVIRTSLAGSAEAWNDINGTFWSILNRGDDAGGIASAEGLLASGAVTLQGWRVTVADSPEAQNDIIGIVQQVLNRQPLGADITYGQMQFIGGANQAILRADWAYGTEAQGDVDGFYARELDRAPTASELSAEQAALASGSGTQGQLRSNLAWGTEAGGKIWSIYQSVLGRPATQTEIQAWQTGMANGSQTLAGVQSYEAYTGEAQGRLDWLYTVVLGRSVDSQGLSYFEGELASGTSEAQVRVQLAQTTEAAGKLGGLFWQVLDRAATAADLSYWEGALGGNVMLSDIGPALSVSAEATADVNGLYEQVLNRAAQASDTQWAESELAAGWTQATVRTNLAYSGEANTDINYLYQVTLGRAADPTGLAAQIAALSSGQNQQQVQVSLAYAPEAANDIQNLYSYLFGRAASASEVTGFQAALASSLSSDPKLTVSGSPGVFATADGAAIVNQIPVYVTLNNGVTPTLTAANGQVFSFSDATALSAFALGLAVKSQDLSSDLVATYRANTNWLNQVNQPLLQQGESLIRAAAAANASGNSYLGSLYSTDARVTLSIAATAPGTPVNRFLTAAQQFISTGFSAVAQGNWNLVAEEQAGADVCLQLSQMSPLQAMIYAERVYQNNGATTVDVGVDPTSADPYGTATYHSKDQSGGVGAFLEPILTAVLDLVAAIPGPQQVLTVPAAAAVNAGEAVQQFAQGNALAGVLDAGTAAGFGALGAGLQATAGAIFSATAIVGGSAGIAQSAEQGNALGVLAGSLEVAAGAAGGLISLKAIPQADVSAIQNIAIGLGIAGGVIGGANAIAHGDIADGLLDTLGPLFSLLTTDHASISSSIAHTASQQPLSIEIPSGGVAFVGGFFDSWNSGGGIVGGDNGSAAAFAQANPRVNVKYFSCDDVQGLESFITSNGGNVAVIAHSYGGSTAASVVAAGYHVQTLVTLDPVGYLGPSFAQVSANAGTWIDFNATGSNNAFANGVAGLGAAFNNGPAGYASYYANVPLDHASIGGAEFVTSLPFHIAGH